MWIPPEEKDPVLKHAPTKKNISIFGAVNSHSGLFTTMASPIFNADSFLMFLKSVFKTRKKNKKILMILDNARYHHAVILKPWLIKNRKKIQLLFLPAYSPELNHIERVWKLTRRLCTHNQYFETMQELINRITNQFDLWRKPNETLRKLCCII
jgi:transposase